MYTFFHFVKDEGNLVDEEEKNEDVESDGKNQEKGKPWVRIFMINLQDKLID